MDKTKEAKLKYQFNFEAMLLLVEWNKLDNKPQYEQDSFSTTRASVMDVKVGSTLD
jgi:hypothetical protein